jgi:hypothetical protein
MKIRILNARFCCALFFCVPVTAGPIAFYAVEMAQKVQPEELILPRKGKLSVSFIFFA